MVYAGAPSGHVWQVDQALAGRKGVSKPLALNDMLTERSTVARPHSAIPTSCRFGAWSNPGNIVTINTISFLGYRYDI